MLSFKRCGSSPVRDIHKDNFVHAKPDTVLKFHWLDITINTLSERQKLTQKQKCFSTLEKDMTITLAV